VHVIGSPTGTGKTTEAARFVAKSGSAIWLTDRHEDAAVAVGMIEEHGGRVGRILPLRGTTRDIPNCLHPGIVERWQDKGYDYRRGFCPLPRYCTREGNPDACPFLASLRDIEEARIGVFTKALARKPSFFSSMGNPNRDLVVIDEDPIGLLRPAIQITREDLVKYLSLLDKKIRVFEREKDDSAKAVAIHSRRVAQWSFDQINRQPANGQPEAVAVPPSLRPMRAVLRMTKQRVKAGRSRMVRAFHKLMRRDPDGMVRNVYRDLNTLLKHAAGETVFVTSKALLFHVKVTIPRRKRVIILDATANEELLRPILYPRGVVVVCKERVEPRGRVIQIMDFNGPRSYLNTVPKKLVRIIDAIGALHPVGTIILISHKSCVDKLRDASKHKDRIKTAWFGALRGRNDLEPGPGNPVACHIVAGSPKTTEEDRRQLAFAVFGKGILPFSELVTVRRAIVGRVPAELADENEQARVWELKVMGYLDGRMQAVYDHTVTAELTHAADRARVLIHQDAVVFLVTNEPCPKLWFSEMAFGADLLDLAEQPRSDFERNSANYTAKAKELLDAGKMVGNADICRELGKNPCWGKRYWTSFRAANQDGLEGDRKVRWKQE
jgi:hypothetical protein